MLVYDEKKNVSGSFSLCSTAGCKASYTLYLLEDAGVQIFVHVFVLEGILSSLLRRVHRGVEVLQLHAEAHTNLKRVRHVGV